MVKLALISLFMVSISFSSSVTTPWLPTSLPSSRLSIPRFCCSRSLSNSFSWALIRSHASSRAAFCHPVVSPHHAMWSSHRRFSSQHCIYKTVYKDWRLSTPVWLSPLSHSRIILLSRDFHCSAPLPLCLTHPLMFLMPFKLDLSLYSFFPFFWGCC